MYIDTPTSLTLSFFVLSDRDGLKGFGRKIRKKRHIAEGGMALNKFSVLVLDVGTHARMAHTAKCSSSIPAPG